MSELPTERILQTLPNPARVIDDVVPGCGSRTLLCVGPVRGQAWALAERPERGVEPLAPRCGGKRERAEGHPDNRSHSTDRSVTLIRWLLS